MSMLFKIDTQYGHVIEDTPTGPVYQDDGSPVDHSNPRPCLGCGVSIAGGHDPCIANLPGTLNACCGHGREKTPGGNLPGYVALEDGRCFRFSGCAGGRRIREVVASFLQGEALPDGFALDDEQLWWAGLSEAQRTYVDENIPRGLAKAVTEAKNGEPPSELFLKGEAMWWDGLNDEQKQYVWGRMGAMLAELVAEAVQLIPG